MKMYSLYNDGDFLGKYVRKDQAISDILDFYQFNNRYDKKVNLFKTENDNEWIFVKDNKVITRYKIKGEDV